MSRAGYAYSSRDEPGKRVRPVKRRKSNKIIPVIVICGILLLIWQALVGGRGKTEEDGLFSGLLEAGRDQGIRELMPVLAGQSEGREEREGLILREESLGDWMPGYIYQTQSGQVAVQQEHQEAVTGQEETELSLEELMRMENQESTQEEGVVVLDLESLLAENGWDVREPSPEEEAAVSEVVDPESRTDGGAFTEFIPHIRQQVVDLTALQDYETLRNGFYIVDSVTNIGRDLLDVDALTDRDMTIDKESAGPQILIYHTHSQEGFADSVPGDESTTIMGVGQHLADILEEQYGYQVLHHEGTYDVPGRDDAYSRSLPEITRLLEENPQIQVVIDLHRDAVADENTRLVMDLDGRPTARFMFFNGISWTRRTGSISYLQNDNLPDNLAFSFQMKLKAEEYYPGLTRKNYINGYRYNMHLRPRTLLIELGAQNNTLEEAMNACDPIAHLLDLVLSGEEAAPLEAQG